MGIIDLQTFSGIADRLATQAGFIQDALVSAQQEGGGFYYPRIHHGVNPSVGDFNVENDLIAAMNTVDEDLEFSTAATTFYTQWITSLASHVTEATGITTLDDYLTRSGIDVHENFWDVFNSVTGQTLSAVNVFREDILSPMGTVDFSGSGVFVFTDGFKLGTGTGVFVPPDSTNSNLGTTANSAAQALQIVVNSGIGANNIVIDVRMSKEDGSQIIRNVVVPSSATVGNVFNIGNSGVDMVLDVLGVNAAGGDTGDAIVIKSLLERQIAL